MATGTAVSKQTSVVEREALAQRVADAVTGAFTKLAAAKDDIDALWVEFRFLPKGETIMGCATKTEFCEKVLGRSIRAVQYLLNGRESQAKPEPTPLHEQSSRPAAPIPVDPPLTRLRELARDRYSVKQTKAGFTLHDTDGTGFQMKFPTEEATRYFLTEVNPPIVKDTGAYTDAKFTIDESNLYLRCLNIPVKEYTTDECAHRSIETLNNLFTRLTYLKSKTPVTRCRCENSSYHSAYDLTLQDLSDDQVYTIYRILAGELPLSSVRHRVVDPTPTPEPVKSDVEYNPKFLTKTEADELLAFLKAQQVIEKRLSYGPQIFPMKLRNRPEDVWATNIQPEPEFIKTLRERMSDHCGVPFNSVQCNFRDSTTKVNAHADTYGWVCMLRVGDTQTFDVGGVPFHNMPFKSYSMPHGSLLVMRRSLTHKASPQPGNCISVIFRLVTARQTTADWYGSDGKVNPKKNREHHKAYDALVAEYPCIKEARKGMYDTPASEKS